MNQPPEGAAPKRKSPTSPASETSGVIESLQMHSNLKPVGKATNLAGMRVQAVALARQGFRVFPLQPGTKFPAIDAWPTQASSDPDRVHRFWSEALSGDPLDFNIGIATGNGLFVVDIDVKGGKDGRPGWKAKEAAFGNSPATLTVASASSHGVHFYFRCPDEMWIGSRPCPTLVGIDIKGDGGYVVGPGSIIAGEQYRVIMQEAPAIATPWLLELAQSQRPVKTQAPAANDDDLDTPDAIARATSWLVNGAPLHGTYGVANRVLDFGVTIDTACELMLDHWNDRRPEPRSEEHILERVRHAAKYRHTPIGSSSADVEFDVVALAPEHARSETGHDEMPATAGATPWQICMAADVSARALLQSARPLVAGILDCGAMSMLYAPPGSGKTFLMLSIAYAIASGTAWAGRKCHRGLVVYLVAEGGGGFAKRVMALQKCHGFGGDLPLGILQVSADLRSNKVDCKKLIAAVRDLERTTGEKCVLIVVDTLSRVLAGGDENSSVDGGALVKNLDEIREAIVSHVMVVHHTGKNESKGARGWSGFKAALDTELEIIDKALHVTKQRDLEFARPIGFRLESVELGQDADGAPVSSAVARMDVAPLEDFGDGLTPAQERMMGAFKSAAANKYGDRYRPGDDAFVLTSKEWDAKFDEMGSRHSPIGGRSRQTLDTHRLALLEKCLVKKIKRAQWVAIQ